MLIAEGGISSAEIMKSSDFLNKPLLHAGGQLAWSISPRVLDYIEHIVPEGSRSLETGAGLSTSFFAHRGYEHTAITPSADEIARVKTFCSERGIDHSHITFITGKSDDVLPSLISSFDFILIDGAHGFPLPSIDWYYGARLLKVGGIIAIDDVQLWSVKILVDFLKGEKDWTHLKTIEAKTSFFRLDQPFSYEEWLYQPYTERKSRWSRRISRLTRLASYVSHGEWKRISDALKYKT